MTEKNKASGKLSSIYAFILLLMPIGLFLMSSWADRKAADVEGPSRLVKGPNDTIYAQIDRCIAKVSSEGELLSALDLDTDASVPDIADFFVEEDGSLLLVLQDSQLLQHYSPEGKLLNTLMRLPSPSAEEDHSCSLAKDPATGILYVSDTSHNRIRMFGPDQKEIKSITVPSGTSASPFIDYLEEAPNVERAFSSKTPFHSPHGLSFAADRLIATDTGNSRIVLFYPDGTLDKIVPVFPLESSSIMYPVKVDRSGDTIYVVVRGPGLIGGKVRSFEFNTGLPREFRYSGLSDPWDVLARRNDILVADRASLTVLRYAHSGHFLGTFGKSGLESLYAGSQIKRKTYDWIGKGSFAGMIAVIGWVLFTLSNRLAALQNVLGRFGNTQRQILLLIPGLGQAAAGKPLRAVILLLTLLYFASLFIYSGLHYHTHVTPLSLSMLTTTGLMAYSVWISIILDGMRLTSKTALNEDPTAAKRRCKEIFAPLITLCCAAAAQLAREFIARDYPETSQAVQELFYSLNTAIHGNSSLSAAALPASIAFGWGGASAALFGSLAWRAKTRWSEVAVGMVIGFLAGISSWLFTVALASNGLDWLLYAPPIQGILLGSFTYLYFRRKRMPLFIIPAAVAGAWMGYFLKFFFGLLAGSIRHILPEGGDGDLWIGAIARMELILIPAYFIHVAIWVTWNIASDIPAGDSDVVIRNVDGLN